MPIHNVLDDREPQAGAAPLAAAFDVHAIETLGQPRDRLAGYPLPLVCDSHEDLSALAPALRCNPAERHPYGAVLAPVFDGVVNQILKNLRELIAFAHDDERALRRNFDSDG